MTKQQMAREVLDWFDDPYGQLRHALLANQESSLELYRRTGVPGATIRSLRNGQSAAVTAKTWAVLMKHLHGARWEQAAR